MKPRLKQLLVSAIAMATVATGAFAQEYPNKPVKIVVGYVAGGGPDTVARLLGQRLSQILGQPFVVENKPGAAGTVATAQVALAPADGYTLLLGETGQLQIAPYMYKQLPYDPVKDFTPVSLVATSAGLILVSNAKSSLKTMQDVMTQAKAHPGTFNYGTSGIGTIHHIAMEVFKSDTGLDATHIPYKGSGQSISGVLAGDIPVLFTSFPAADALIRDGVLTALAISAPQRVAAYPNVPTLAEFAKGYDDYLSEMGILAPAGLPPQVLARLSAAIKQAMESPELLASFKKLYYHVKYITPEEYAENIRRNMKKYEKAVGIAKLTGTQ